MNLDDLERALTGEDLTGTDAAAALGLLLVGVGLYFVVGWLLRRSAARWSQTVVPDEAIQLGIKLAQILALFIFVAWALTVLGARIGWITIMVIAVLLIAALVAKPFLEALASSFVVAGRSAFSVGDEIGFDGIIGKVQGITNRSTVVRTRDGRRIHIPNSELLDRPVTVYTAYDERRSAIDFTVALQTDIDALDGVIREALAPIPSVSRVGSIRARSFSEGVDLSVRIWHGPALSDGNDAIDTAVRHLKVAFEEAGIKFAPTDLVQIERPKPDRSTT